MGFPNQRWTSAALRKRSESARQLAVALRLQTEQRRARTLVLLGDAQTELSVFLDEQARREREDLLSTISLIRDR